MYIYVKKEIVSCLSGQENLADVTRDNSLFKSSNCERHLSSDSKLIYKRHFKQTHSNFETKFGHTVQSETQDLFVLLRRTVPYVI